MNVSFGYGKTIIFKWPEDKNDGKKVWQICELTSAVRNDLDDKGFKAKIIETSKGNGILIGNDSLVADAILDNIEKVIGREAYENKQLKLHDEVTKNGQVIDINA